jgi:rubrerythrin
MEKRMASLIGSRTEDNLKAAFAGESQANRRYLYFAQKADIEGYNDVSAVFRSTAEGETGHAYGHLEYLEEVGDPATGKPIGGTADNLRAAIAGEPTNIRTCIRGWPARLAKRVSRRSPSDLKPSPKPKGLTPAAFRRLSMGSEQI